MIDNEKDSFFNEAKDHSIIKATIVQKYFWSWAKIMANRTDRICYLDLFAGPGRYDDGTKSTPLLVLETAITDEKMRGRLITIFNDKDERNVMSLQTEIEKLNDVTLLKNKPKIMNQEIGVEMVRLFESFNLVPTLFFIDPWGYKGLSLQLINSVLRNWGCDCIIFFNYNRINMGLSNAIVKEALDSLFGEERAEQLRAKLKGLPPEEREAEIVEGIMQALYDMGGKYSLPFTFKNEKGTRTKHHLIFSSKHPLGYKIMKGIMANMSSEHEQGVPTFEYNPSVTNRQPLLFELNRPLDELEGMLLQDFRGQTLTCGDLIELHHVGKRYIEKNYKQVLLAMENKGLISCESLKGTRKKNTMADHIKITFQD